MTEELEQLFKNLHLKPILEVYDDQLRSADEVLELPVRPDYCKYLRGKIEIFQNVEGK